MRAIPLNLTDDVVSIYDQTKTTVYGRAAKKTLSALQGGKTVVGTPLTSFADSTTDAAVTPSRGCVSDNGHELIFAASSAGGLILVALYDINETTGVKTYVGRINIQLSTTTHTIRGVRLLNDSGATGWQILITTIGTIAANGGLFSVENIAKADFTSSPPTIPVATAAGQKAVYWHQETGGTNNLTVSQGFGHPQDAGSSSKIMVVANGLVATPNFYLFKTDATIITVGAGGVTTDWYVAAGSVKTGTVTGLTGTFLLLNNYSMCIPDASSGVPLALQGALCLFIPSSTVMGLVKVSDITSGATTLPSYTTKDLLDTSNTNTAVTPATMHFSQTLQRVVFQLNAGSWIIKKFVNAQYDLVLGDASNSQYRTAQPIPFYEFGGITVVSTYEHAGWLYEYQSTVGQIGALAYDLRSLYQFDFSSIVSKVLDVSNMAFVALSILAPIRSFAKIYYKQSGFGTPLTGWTELPLDRVMSGIANTTGQIQFKFAPRAERDSVTVPIQMIEAHLLTTPTLENSLNWNMDVENSTKSTESPGRSAAILIKAYTSSVPKIRMLAYSRATGLPVRDKNTTDHPTEFQYSGDSGTSWNALGTIPNVINSTRLRYNWASPIPEDVDIVWIEG